jgi:hypothetical protein
MTALARQSEKWDGILKLGGAAALAVVLTGVLETAITFLPGGNTAQVTVLDWFSLFQINPFMGMRNLGLLNIFLNGFSVLLYFAFYAAHRDHPLKPYAALTALVAIIGAAIFYATNRSFAMLALSQQYAAAASEAQRAVLEAAGASLLAVGQSHTPGTFLGFFLLEAAGLLASIVMLRSGIFSRATAIVGILGWSTMLIFEYTSSFAAGLSSATMLVAMLGGLLSMVWSVLIALRFFQLAKKPHERISN